MPARWGFLLFFILYGVFPFRARVGVQLWIHVACLIASSHRKQGKLDAIRRALASSACVPMPCSAVLLWGGESCMVNSQIVLFPSWCWVIRLELSSSIRMNYFDTAAKLHFYESFIFLVWCRSLTLFLLKIKHCYVSVVVNASSHIVMPV